MGIKGMWKDLRTSPVDTLVRWQEQRLLWLLITVAMGALIILAHSFFQIYLYMAPCEQCVYIRYAMFVMVIGGLVAAINPKNIILKLIGCVMAFYGSILGLKFSLKLNDIHHAVHNPIPIHCLAYRVALPIQLFPLTCRWHSGHQIGSSLPGIVAMTHQSFLMASH